MADAPTSRRSPRAPGAPLLAWRQYRLERRMFWRNPSAAFFNFLLPLLILAGGGAILSGNQHDLNKLVPSVGLVGTFNGRVPLGMRGISSNANESTVGLASGVAIMVDGVPVPSDSRSRRTCPCSSRTRR